MRKKLLPNKLLKEWHGELNQGIESTELKRSSDYDAWWKCHVCNQIWKAKVKSRTNGSGCPYCAGRVPVLGTTDLQTLYPELAKEWVSEEKGRQPWEVTKGSHAIVTWQCKEGHRWTAQVKARVLGNDCPFCSGRRILHGVNDIMTLFPQIMEQWDWDKNGDVDPATIGTKSDKKYWWRCEQCGYEWLSAPSYRTRHDRNSGCPCCNHKVMVPGRKNAATCNPDMVKDWDTALNEGKNLVDYFPNSNQYANWKCHKCNQIWSAQIKSRVIDNKGCPFCGGKRSIKGKNDLKTLFPYLCEEWDSDVNMGLKPEDFRPYSHKKVGWKCSECGYRWRAKIANRTLGRGCPQCAPNRQRKEVT